MQTDPNFANYLWDAGAERVGLLDFGATRSSRPRSWSITFASAARSFAAIATRCARACGGDRLPRLRAISEAQSVRRSSSIMLVCEPLRHRGRYDFGASDLPARVRELGFDLAFRKRLLRAPPPADAVPAPEARRRVPAPCAHPCARGCAGAHHAVPARSLTSGCSSAPEEVVTDRGRLFLLAGGRRSELRPSADRGSAGSGCACPSPRRSRCRGPAGSAARRARPRRRAACRSRRADVHADVARCAGHARHLVGVEVVLLRPPVLEADLAQRGDRRRP